MDRILNKTFLKFSARFILIIIIGVFGALLIGQVSFDENKATSAEVEK